MLFPNPSERLIRIINTNSDGPVAGKIFTFLQKYFPHVPEKELKERERARTRPADAPCATHVAPP